VFHKARSGDFGDTMTYVARMKWKDWGSRIATASGTFEGNVDFHAKATVRLTRPQHCLGLAASVYTHFAISIQGDRLALYVPQEKRRAAAPRTQRTVCPPPPDEMG
jgi:hypothetical protein